MLRVNAKRIFKTISGLAAANVFSQGVQLVAQPWLARMYAPDQFGLVGQFTALTSIISIFGTWQIHNYLVLIKEKSEVQRMTRVGFSLTHLMSIVVLLVFLVFSSSIYGVQANSNLELAILTTVLVVVVCYASLLRGSLTAEGHFRDMMWYIVVRGAVVILVQFLFGRIGILHGLIYGIIIGELVAQSRFLLTALSDLRRFTFSQPIKEIKVSFQRYREFMVSGSIQELVSVTALMAPLYFIGKVYGHETGGQFALAYRMIWAPFLLLVQSISPILYHYISKLNSSQINSNQILNPYINLVVFVVFSALCFPFIGPVFDFAFDEKWALAANMSSWIFLWAFSFFCALPFRVCYRILNKQRIQLYVDAVTLITVAVVFIVDGISNYQIVPMVCLIAIVQNLIIVLLAKRFILQNASSLQKGSDQPLIHSNLS
jgi:lipopolysaccharide exporter